MRLNKLIITAAAVFAIVLQPFYAVAAGQVAHAASNGPFSAVSTCSGSNTVVLDLSLEEALPGWFLGGDVYYTTPYGSSPKHWLGVNDTDAWTVDTGATTVASVSVSAKVKDPVFGINIKTYTLTTDALDCTPPPATINTCTAVTNVHTTDLSTWDTSRTRAAGTNTLVADGLHVVTKPSTGGPYENYESKAAASYNTNFSLQDLGTDTIVGILDYTTNSGTIPPGAWLDIDFDGNGSVDGTLIGEAVYGNNWWLNGDAAPFVASGAPHVGGGNGSPYFGTAAEWLNAFPAARVKAVGYGLGGGVVGDYLIKKITVGCVEYTFGLPTVTPVTPVTPVNPVSPVTPVTPAPGLPVTPVEPDSQVAVADTNPDAEVKAATDVKGSDDKAEVSSTSTSASSDDKHWSLVNVLLAAVVVLQAVVALAAVRASQNREKLVRLLTIVPVAVSLIVLLTVEDFSAKLGMVNAWTLLFLVAVVAQTALLANIKKSDK